MVDYHENDNHNVVIFHRRRSAGEHVLPQFEAASETEMNFMPGLDRDDILMALKISGAIVAAMAVTGAITFYILG